MENKKGFIMYADQKGIWDKLDEVQAGRLIKHVLAYVNDEDPEAPDFITELAFEPIKQSLKRDLKKWADQKERRRAAGAKGGLAKSSNARNGLAKPSNATNDVANVAVIVKDSVSVSVTDSVSVTVKENRELEFRRQAATHSQYSKELVDAFCNYWTESKPNGKKMRFEMQKTFDIKRRLATWAKNESQFNKSPNLSPIDQAMNNLNQNVNEQLNNFDI